MEEIIFQRIYTNTLSRMSAIHVHMWRLWKVEELKNCCNFEWEIVDEVFSLAQKEGAEKKMFVRDEMWYENREQIQVNLTSTLTHKELWRLYGISRYDKMLKYRNRCDKSKYSFARIVLSCAARKAWVYHMEWNGIWHLHKFFKLKGKGSKLLGIPTFYFIFLLLFFLPYQDQINLGRVVSCECLKKWKMFCIFFFHLLILLLSDSHSNSYL